MAPSKRSPSSGRWEAMNLTFLSWHGLGNSILNFPLLSALRQQWNVKVLCFNNGSASFFRAFHEDVVGVTSKREMLTKVWLAGGDDLYACYPTWKREVASLIVSRATRKHALRCPDIWTPPFMHWSGQGDPSLHHLENNMNVLMTIPELAEADPKRVLNVRADLLLVGPPTTVTTRRLGLHPTASTEAKYYPKEFWIDLVHRLQGEFAEILVFCGSSQSEKSFCQSLLAGLDAAVAKRTFLHAGVAFDRLSSLIDSTSHFVGSDSALMHLAALMDKNVLGLWSFANFRVIYPYGDHAAIYVPSETLKAEQHEYPDHAAPYLKRASAQTVAQIVCQGAKADFTLAPKYKNAVRAFVY